MRKILERGLSAGEQAELHRGRLRVRNRGSTSARTVDALELAALGNRGCQRPRPPDRRADHRGGERWAGPNDGSTRSGIPYRDDEPAWLGGPVSVQSTPCHHLCCVDSHFKPSDAQRPHRHRCTIAPHAPDDRQNNEFSSGCDPRASPNQRYSTFPG
jgi:hypothetical protein